MMSPSLNKQGQKFPLSGEAVNAPHCCHGAWSTAETLHGLMEGIVKEWAWQWSTMAEPECDRALALLRAQFEHPPSV